VSTQPWDVEVTEPEDATDVTVTPDPPITGDEAVDKVVAEVAQALHRPLEEQVAVIDAAHRTLQDRLADVEG
jgi:hypothetical protein